LAFEVEAPDPEVVLGVEDHDVVAAGREFGDLDVVLEQHFVEGELLHVALVQVLVAHFAECVDSRGVEVALVGDDDGEAFPHHHLDHPFAHVFLTPALDVHSGGFHEILLCVVQS